MLFWFQLVASRDGAGDGSCIDDSNGKESADGAS